MIFCGVLCIRPVIIPLVTFMNFYYAVNIISTYLRWTQSSYKMKKSFRYASYSLKAISSIELNVYQRINNSILLFTSQYFYSFGIGKRTHILGAFLIFLVYPSTKDLAKKIWFFLWGVPPLWPLKGGGPLKNDPSSLPMTPFF